MAVLQRNDDDSNDSPRRRPEGGSQRVPAAAAARHRRLPSPWWSRSSSGAPSRSAGPRRGVSGERPRALAVRAARTRSRTIPGESDIHEIGTVGTIVQLAAAARRHREGARRRQAAARASWPLRGRVRPYFIACRAEEHRRGQRGRRTRVPRLVDEFHQGRLRELRRSSTSKVPARDGHEPRSRRSMSPPRLADSRRRAPQPEASRTTSASCSR